jgi:hypothetical protein
MRSSIFAWLDDSGSVSVPTRNSRLKGFNIANRTNYSTVNNVVGANFASPFSVHGTSAVSPSQPLGYTAALPKREIQLGVRFDFELLCKGTQLRNPSLRSISGKRGSVRK